MAGKTHDYIFYKDGTVDFSAVDGVMKGNLTHEKHSAAVKVADCIFVVSYLGASENTLIVVLNLKQTKLVCFASNNKEWSQQIGTF
jgi:phenolic acid decarboxylase